jgi:hypothetical protein
LRHGTARRLQAGTTTRRIRRSIRSSGRKTLRRRTTGGEYSRGALGVTLSSDGEFFRVPAQTWVGKPI